MLPAFSMTHCAAYAYDNAVFVIYSAVNVSKDAKIRNRYNQVPHMTQDTNVKVTT